MSSCLG